jgi:putative DNA methylase
VVGNGSLFIESPRFPVDAVNIASAREKRGGGRPDYWEMVFWWTRKPLAGARAVIAASALPHDIDPSGFRVALRLGEGVAHRKNPARIAGWAERFAGMRLLDPFAGFGSIPLEAVRLGVGEVVASELLPTAYVFLKAVLEYPKWAVDKGVGKRLVEDVRRWGEWVVQRLKEDQDIRDLYESDVAVYIGTWEIRCPHCGRWTPLIGNWWLARVRRGGAEEGEEGVSRAEYERLAWMEPQRVGDEIAIKIVDLNKELNNTKRIRASINTKAGRVEAGGKTYRVPSPNIDARKEAATCLYCNNLIKGSRGSWMVKQALREWNNKLEQYLSGGIELEKLLRETPARPRILAKVKITSNNLEFEPASREDVEKLWKALEKLRTMWGDPDIPTEPIPEYESRSIWVLLYGFNRFFKLFNPRQLLTLVKLVKLIREAGKKIEEEKLREGWSREDAYKYAEAITTYLAIALVRYAEHTSLATTWTSSTGFSSSLALKPANIMTYRGIAMVWNWCDTLPFVDFAGSYMRALEINEDGLSYLTSAVSGSPSRIRVLLDDATSLNKLADEKFDLIVTDPPYRDDVAYAELSDFYYVWLKRALSDVADVGGIPVRIPRFVAEAFFEDGSEIEVQWKVFAPREVSEAEGRSRYFGSAGGRGVGSFDYFKDLLARSFKSMASRLSDGGALVTYYAHTSPDAWEALLEAGWREAGLRITAAHALATESLQRVTARGKASLDISIVSVWRRGSSGQGLAEEVFSRAVEGCTGYADNLYRSGLRGVDLFVGVLGCVLSEFTKYERVVGVDSVRDLVERYVYPATAEAIARMLGGEASARLRGSSIFYLLAKVLVDRRARQRRRSLDRSSVNILAIGTRVSLDELARQSIVRRSGEGFELVEPAWGQDPIRSLREVLEDRGIDLRSPSPRNPVDLLHIMEYYSSTLPSSELSSRLEELRSRYPSLYEEALSLARLISRLIGDMDPEAELAGKLVAFVEPRRSGLEKWEAR